MSPHPMSQMPAAAATHALLLPDTLFSIVPHLDLHSLLRGKRFCQIWKSVISRSHEARQVLFLETDPTPFEALKAAEEHDIAVRTPAAWQRPSIRIRSRPEFRAMFNPCIFTHGCEAISLVDEHEIGAWQSIGYRRMPPMWRFTDRVSSGRLDFCLTPADLKRFAGNTASSCESMFLTQPPTKECSSQFRAGICPKRRSTWRKTKV